MRKQKYKKKLKRLINDIIKVVFPLMLGAIILWWTYRDFDFSQVSDVLWHKMNWWWMGLSIPFGILAQMFRGWRWKQTLEPMGEFPTTTHCVNSIFVSYAANLLIPRVGEVSRCGILKQYDGVSFSKSLGTVVTERIIDSLCVLLITGLTLISQMSVFNFFFKETGTDLESVIDKLGNKHITILTICAIAILIVGAYIVHRMAIFTRVKKLLSNVFEGIFSLKDVKSIPLFVAHTAGIWICYILHFYLTFFAFDFTYHLGFVAGLVLFAVGSLAVVVPTPNGAGPWHFAVITMLMLYGVGESDAEIFALLVHAIQTLLIILLGIWGLLSLSLEKKMDIQFKQ